MYIWGGQPIVKWYFGLNGRKFMGSAVWRLKSGRGVISGKMYLFLYLFLGFVWVSLVLISWRMVCTWDCLCSHITMKTSARSRYVHNHVRGWKGMSMSNAIISIAMPTLQNKLWQMSGYIYYYSICRCILNASVKHRYHRRWQLDKRTDEEIAEMRSHTPRVVSIYQWDQLNNSWVSIYQPSIIHR